MDDRNAGGPAAAGGMNFQAAVTSFAMVRLLCGSPVNWLTNLTTDIPVAVSSETGGAGDDIHLELAGGQRVEIQAKKGLRAGKKLQAALLNLAEGIHNKSIDFGVLAVSSSSSTTIRQTLAENIVRRGDGRTDSHCENAHRLFYNLRQAGYDEQKICRKLRIVTLHFGTGDNASLDNSQLNLESLLAEKSSAKHAWNALYKSASSMIENRGRKDLRGLVNLFRSHNLVLKEDKTAEPATILSAFCRWVVATNTTIPMFGMNSRARTEDCWIDLNVVAQEPKNYGPQNLPEALEQYHSWERKSAKKSDDVSDAKWLGRFFRKVVVVAGPGMGKSCLMTMLARLYAEGVYPVFKVNLKQVALKIQGGSTFEEAVFAFGSDGSGFAPSTLENLRLTDAVFLFDGLDECGKDRAQIAEKIVRLSEGRPSCRFIVTTRPIGYDPSPFSNWRHCDLLPPDSFNVARNIDKVLNSLDSGHKEKPEWSKLIASELDSDFAKSIAGRSPLMITISASLLFNGQTLGRSKPETYKKVFTLIDNLPSVRSEETNVPKSTLAFVLDCLAWDVIKLPYSNTEEREKRVSQRIAIELGCSQLKATEIFSNCLTYWQSKGVVETISVGLTESMTFVHKTFSEYAAARYLADLPTDEKTQLLQSVLFDADFREVLGFAAALGCAKQILESYENSEAERSRKQTLLAYLLGAIAEGRALLDDASANYLVQRAVETVLSDRSDLGFRVGLSLSKFARQYPETIRPYCPALFDSAQIWTRLTAWNVALGLGEQFYNLDRLQSEIALLPNNPELSTLFSPFGGFQLYDDGQRELLNGFILKGIDHLLTRLPENEVDSFLPDVLAADQLSTVGLIQDAQLILKKHGREYNIKSWRMESEQLKSFAQSFDPEFYHEKQKLAFQKMFSNFPVSKRGEVHRGETSDYLNLSALIELTGLWEETPGEFQAWNRPHPPEPISEVWRLLLAIIEIDLEDLLHEVKLFKMEANQPFDKKVLGPFHLFKRVDVPEPDFRLIKDLTPNAVLLEQAVHHPVTWVKNIAVQALNEAVDGEQKADCVVRLLSEGEGTTIWMAAWLAEQINGKQAFELVVARLKQPLSRGCEYIYSLLKELEIESEEDVLEVLKIGLFSARVAVAVAAADYALYAAEKISTDFSPILFDAFAHWKTHEEPYPQSGGAVPLSPRENLLKALSSKLALDDKFLFTLLSDTRSDVRNLAEKIAREKIKQGSGQEILDKAVDSQEYFGFLKGSISLSLPLNDYHISKIAQFFKSNDPNGKLCCLMLVENGYSSETQTSEILEHLKIDDLQQIRDRVKEFLEQRALVTS